MDDADLEQQLRALRLEPPPATLDARIAPAGWHRRWLPLAAAGITTLIGAAAWWSSAGAPAAGSASVAVNAHAAQRSVTLHRLPNAVGSQVTTSLLDPQTGVTTTITQRVVVVRLDRATVY